MVIMYNLEAFQCLNKKKLVVMMSEEIKTSYFANQDVLCLADLKEFKAMRYKTSYSRNSRRLLLTGFKKLVFS